MKTLLHKVTKDFGASLDYAPDWWRREENDGFEIVTDTYFMRLSKSTVTREKDDVYKSVSFIFWKLQITVVIRS